VSCSVLPHVSCSVLQCVIVCCSELQLVAVCCSGIRTLHKGGSHQAVPPDNWWWSVVVCVLQQCVLQGVCCSVCVLQCVCVAVRCSDVLMGWLWLVGSIKLQVSFAKEPNKRDNILQKGPIILSILLTVATPYPAIQMVKGYSTNVGSIKL